jgi:hypothetical protein
VRSHVWERCQDKIIHLNGERSRCRMNNSRAQPYCRRVANDKKWRRMRREWSWLGLRASEYIYESYIYLCSERASESGAHLACFAAHAD